MDGWHDFFVAQVGASAVLVGLIFVGVSINLNKILSFSGLPARALESLLILLAVLTVSSLALVPGQSLSLFGAEVLAVGILAWITVVLSDLRVVRGADAAHRRRYLTMIVINQLAVVSYIIAGASILSTGTAGLYWLVPAVLLSLIKALVDAWVLLVEINR